MILIEQGKVSVESTAALNICRKFDGLWPCFYAFILVPPFYAMHYIAYLQSIAIVYLGKSECLLPTPAQRQRFLS